MKCLNISNLDFLQLVKDTGIPSFKLDYIVSKWMEETGEDRFPTKEEVLSSSIPQGITKMLRSLGINKRTSMSGYEISRARRKATSKGYTLEVKKLGEADIYEILNVTPTNDNKQTRLFPQLSNIQEKPVNEKLDAILTELLTSLGISVETVDRIQTDRGLDAVAMTDILNKIIKVARGKADRSTLAEESSHVVLALLGKDSPMVQRIMSLIDQTDTYTSTKEEYFNTYNGDLEKIKEEAAGKLLAKYLVDDQLKSERNKTLIGKIINTFNMILTRIKNMFKNVNEVALQDKLDEAFGVVSEKMLSKSLEDLSFKNVKNSSYYQLGENEVWKGMPMQVSNLTKLEEGEKRVTIRPNFYNNGYYKFGNNYYHVTAIQDKKISVKDIGDVEHLKKTFVRNEDLKEQHIKDFFAGKNKMYVYQISRVNDSVSAELKKKERFSKPKEQLQTKEDTLVSKDEAKENMHKAIDIINTYIARWDNNIRRLRLKIVPGDRKNNSVIQNKIDTIKDRIKELKEKQQLELIKATAESQIANIRNRMKNYDSMSYRQKISMFELADEYLGGWQDITTLLEIPEEERELNLTIQKIQGEVEYLLKNLKILQFNFINEFIGKGDLTTADVLGPLDKTPLWESLGLDLSTSGIKALQKTFSFIDDARANAIDKHRVFSEEVKDMHDKTVEYNKTSGMSMKQIFDLFRQRNEEGKLTGNYVNETSQKWYDELNTKEGKERSRWLKENSERVIDYEAYEEARADAEYDFKDSNGEWVDESMYNKWVSDHNPDMYGKDSHRFTEYKPSDKWKDTQWKEIKQGKYKGTHIEKLYDFFIQKMEERKAVIPRSVNTPSNLMPEVKNSIFDSFAKEGMSGMFKFGGTALGESLKGYFGAEIQSENDFSIRDPFTNMPEKRIPVYMLGDLLHPEDKSYDIFKVLDLFGAVSYTYEFKTQVEVPSNIIRKLVKEASQKEEEGGVVKKDIYNKIIGIIGNNQNTFNQLDYYLDAIIYDKRKEDPGSFSKSKILSSPGKDRGFSLTKTLDSLIAYTQLKGMGLNVFASATNSLFGTLSNFVYAAGGEDFTDMQMMKALGIALTTTIGFGENSEKVEHLMQFFQMETLNIDSKYGDEWYKKNITDRAYILQKKTETFNQMQVLIAKMLNTEIVDLSGKKTNLWDAFEIKEGKLHWDNSKFGENKYGDNTEGKQDLRKRLKHIVANLHGAYDSSLPMQAKKTVVGRMLMVFRTWMPRAAYTHFGAEREINGKKEKGRFITLFGKGGYYSQKGLVKGTTGLTWGIMRKMINFGFFKTQSFSQEGLSEVDAVNMRKLSAEVAFDLAILVMGMMLKGIKIKDGDDDKEKAMLKFLINQSSRVDSELAFWWSPTAQTNIIRNIAPPQKTFLDFMEVWDAGWDTIGGKGTYDRGPHKGRSKFWRKFWNAVPVSGNIQRTMEIPNSTVQTSRRKYY